MGSEIYITGYSGLLVSWDTVLRIVHSSLVGSIASGFNIAGYAKLLVSGNTVLLDKPGIADIFLLGSMGSETCTAGYLRLLGSRNTVLQIINNSESLLGLISLSPDTQGCW